MRRRSFPLIFRLGLCVFPALPLTALAGGGFTDIDIRQITAAASAAMPGPISRFDEADWAGCPNTIEDQCTREAVLLIETSKGPRKLIVSNVSDGWIVGRKQQAKLARERDDRDQDELDKKCDRQWMELTRPGHPYEHWTWMTRSQWWNEHCLASPSPPPKPVGIDSSLKGGTSSPR